MVCGSPKIYGQLVQILAPHSRVIKGGEGDASAASVPAAAGVDATQAFIKAHEDAPEAAAAVATDPAPAPAKKAALRVRKNAAQ